MGTSAPIALQLYTVRDRLAKDFAGVVRKIADIGYMGVETAGFEAASPREAGKLFKGLGLTVTSAHMPLPLGEHKEDVLDAMKELDCTRIVSGMGPDAFTSIGRIKESCSLFNDANAVAEENGLAFGIHNHWWEFQEVEGRYVHEVMLECLDARIFFEIDTYWVKTAGPDPAAVVRNLGERAPLLHIKDGPCMAGEPMVAVGDGIMDFASIVEAGKDSIEWMIVELDECATDMMEAVEKSYAYLTGADLARGKKKS
jgi:sugar phosphate isomerase/epimerase